MAVKLRGIERTIWELHCSGLAISQISERTKYDESFVHNAIVRVWSEEGSVVKDG